jgi:large subunit ribosomal protein L35
MPKMKSHSGMGKRVRITGTGKVISKQAGRVHKLEAKPSTRTRRLAGSVVLAKPEAKRAKKLLGR